MRSIQQTPLQVRTEWRVQHGTPYYQFRAYQDRFAAKSARRSLLALQYITAIVLIGALGFFAQHAAVGLGLAGLYAIAAFTLRMPSEHTFKAALVCLLSLPIFTTFGFERFAATYAQYAFLLLCIGMASALWEQWRDGVYFEVGSRMRVRSVAAAGLRYK